jgi:transcription antitermination factor NusG
VAVAPRLLRCTVDVVEWHAIRTAPQDEGRVAIGIGGVGLESYLPVELECQTHRGRTETAWKPLFLNYVFARADFARDLPRLMAIAGVTDVLRQPSGKPAPIADEVIAAIRQAEQMGAFDRTKQARLVEGDTVAIRGAFGGLIARIKCARPCRRATLILELVGFPFHVVAPASKLEKIA